MASKFCDYFEIEKSYYPEINPQSIKDMGDQWKKTFPHKTFVDLLKATERMLSRANSAERKGIWIEGAYGTGKSRIAWTLSKLLNCSDSDLMEYFDSFTALKKEVDLRDKLLAHKKGRILTVERYATGDIDTTRKLIMAVFESVSKALADQGYDIKGQKTLRGRIAEWLKDEDNGNFFFKKIASAPEFSSLGSFSGKNSLDIIAKLEDPTANVTTLIDDIVSVGQKFGIFVFQINMDDLIDWLSEVIDANNLDAIVFIWDEFSSFFQTHKNSLDEFQKLAELSNYKPFYLMIVTHMSGSLVSEGDQSFKKVRDRFISKEITMPDTVAFELIRDALKVKEFKKSEFLEYTSYYKDSLHSARDAVAEVVDMEGDVLDGILPIHPMTALMLKYIATAFASNQRSMFNFIKNSSPDLKAFQWFIENYGPEDDTILSIDYLWNFFYEKGTDEHSFQVGKNNLDLVISSILDTYTMNEKRLNEDEKRVLKVILMMQAISQKMGDAIELLRPNERNLKYAFACTNLSLDCCGIARNKLVNQLNILYIKPGKAGDTVDTFAASAVSGNQSEINNIKNKLKDKNSIDIISNIEFDDVIHLTSAQKMRFSFQIATYSNFVTISNKLSHSQLSKMPLVLCIAKDDEEQIKIQELLKVQLAKPECNKIVYINAASSHMGMDNFNAWIECSANEEYWRHKDNNLADEMHHKAEQIVKQWKSAISSGTFYVNYFISDDKSRHEENCASMSKLQGILNDIVNIQFPYCFDTCNVSDSFFSTSHLAVGGKYGILRQSGAIYQKTSLDHLLPSLWDSSTQYWKEQPQLKISKLKCKLDKYIEKKLEAEVRVSISDIFSKLQGYGFIPCNMYAYLMGFLLRDYAMGDYRYGIGINGDAGGKLDAEHLSNFIGEVVKAFSVGNEKKLKEKYIQVLTKNQTVFMEFAQKAFDCDENSVEQTVFRIRNRVATSKCPVWCYRYWGKVDILPVLEKLLALLNCVDDRSISSVADELGCILSEEPEAYDYLVDLFCKDNGKEAWTRFLNHYKNGKIYEFANRIGNDDILSDIYDSINGAASWLWNEESGSEVINDIILNYQIIDCSNSIGVVSHSIRECMRNWTDILTSVKIPYSILKDNNYLDGDEFYDYLKNYNSSGNISSQKKALFYADLTKIDTQIRYLKEHSVDVFYGIYEKQLVDFNKSEINSIYSIMTPCFFKDKPSFLSLLYQVIDDKKKGQKSFMLTNLWKSKTGSKDAYDWSYKNKTPILCLVNDLEYSRAKLLFETLSNPNAKDIDVANSLSFLEEKPSFINSLKESNLIDAAFRKYILGDYSDLFDDIDEIREYINSATSYQYYDWFLNNDIQRIIADKATKDYYVNGTFEKVKTTIDAMSEDEVRQLLIKLAEADPKIGVSVMAD